MPVALALIAGGYLDGLVALPSWAPPALGLVLISACLAARRRSTRIRTALLLLLVGVVGLGRHHLPYRLDPPATPFGLAPGERVHVVATGVVDGPVQRGRRRAPFARATERTRFRLAVSSLEGLGVRAPCDVDLSVTVYEMVPGLRSGDRLQVRGWLRRPGPPRNPGQRDLAEWMLCEGLAGTLSASGERDVRVLVRGDAHPLSLALHLLRARMLGSIATRLRPREAALLSAMLLGERQDISPEVSEAFERSGAVHFLAISGLHMALIAGSAFWIIRALLALSPILALRWPMPFQATDNLP